MKKWICLLLTLCFLLACTLAQADALRVGVMSGPTGMGLAWLMAQGGEEYAFEIYSAPTEATADLANGTLDLLCLPTNTAAALSNAKEDYVSVLAINCLGTLYLLSDGTVDVQSLQDLAGQVIDAGVQSSTTEPILRRLLEQNNLSATVEWEADHDAVILRMVQGEVHLAVLPEPKATVALSKAEGWSVALNLSTAWEETFHSPMPMGCVVARNDVIASQAEEIAQFMTDCEASIQFIGNMENVAESAQMIAECGILPSAGVATKALQNLNGSLVYEDGAKMKADLIAFYEEIGVALPADAFYYAK